MWRSEIDEAGPLVARQGEDRGVHVGMDVFHAEMLIEALHGLFRRIVVLAEMTEHDVLDAGMVGLGDKAGRLVVAQMAKGTRDPLLEHEGIAAFHQHLLVVVGLDDDVFCPFDLFFDHLVEHPNIGSDGQRVPFITKMEPHGAPTVVHDGERLDGDATNLERLHRLHLVEKDRIHTLGHLTFQDALQTIGMGIDGDGERLGEHLKTLHMVDMVVRDEDSAYARHRDVDLRQGLGDLLGADAHIDKDTLILFPHIIAVAAAARGKAAEDKGRKTGKEVHIQSF